MSHILSEIEIKNFKSIKEESFDLSPFTSIVGYNNAGKSNLLEGIKWLLRKSSLKDSCFNDISAPVEITGKVSGISNTILQKLPDKQQKSIEPYLIAESLYIKRVQGEAGIPASKINLLVKDPNNIGNPNEWTKNPTGLDQALQALFPEPIQIGAMENSEEDVSKSKNTTTIGKLLSEIIGPIQSNYKTQINTALDGVKDLLDAEGSSRATELEDFDTTVNEKVSSFFPDVSLKVHVPTPEIKDIFSRGTIKVFENSNPEGRDVSALGHGAQRSIQMALIRHLADIKRDSGEQVSNTLLLIDEPELYLHPQGIEVLRDALKVLSVEGYQVIFSTHSPMMISPQDFEDTILIRKNDAKGTYKRNTVKSAVRSIFKDNPSQTEVIFSLSNSVNILFADKIILAEGKTENKLLPSIIHKVTGRTLGLLKSALVPIGGSGSTKKSIDVLEAMDLPVKAIVDLDYALKEGEKEGFLSSGDSDVAAVKNHLLSIAQSHSIELNNGWPTKKGSSMTAAEAFELLAKEPQVQSNLESIKTNMKDCGVYVWTKGTIESHLGNINKNEAAWSNFNSRLDGEELDVILPDDYLEIKDFVNWLVN